MSTVIFLLKNIKDETFKKIYIWSNNESYTVIQESHKILTNEKYVTFI